MIRGLGAETISTYSSTLMGRSPALHDLRPDETDESGPVGHFVSRTGAVGLNQTPVKASRCETLMRPHEGVGALTVRTMAWKSEFAKELPSWSENINAASESDGRGGVRWKVPGVSPPWEPPPVQILVVVAHTQVRALRTEAGEGFHVNSS
ncbi:hypothetical protein JTE90_014219 [Oedothorax gibbosus]|uniref:Uncharacterized protein n=1 Tax=Oedothorax gibbosus TaxID=931172 RepID=A0AAV6TCY6_9ARAC|nr:hypothetical protein JTE90_014219 [Oedothorax gibbosus]